MKKCSRCQEIKPETEYYKNPARPDGLHNYCKACLVAYQKGRRKVNKEYLQAQREHRKITPITNTTPEQRFAAAAIVAKARAAKRLAISRGLNPNGLELIAAAMDDVRNYGTGIVRKDVQNERM